MKVKLILIAFFCIIGNRYKAQIFNPQNSESILYGAEANQLIAGANMVRLYSHTRIPAFVQLSSNFVTEENAVSWIKKSFKMPSGNDLKLVKKESDDLGFTHYRFLQTYMGYEIFGSGYIAHCQGGYLVSANGMLFDPTTINERAIDEKAALQLALKKIGATVYKWQIPEEEAQAKHDCEVDKIRKTPSYYPNGELKIIPEDGNFYSKERKLRLAYVFDIYAHEPMDRQDIFVDATTGKILFQNPLIHHGNANGTAITAYSGTRSIVTDSVTSDSFRLREVGRGNGIQTFNMKKGTSYAASVEFRDSNNIWNNVNANKDQYATDGHWGAEMTYDYFLSKHNRNSIDNAGFLLKSYIHYSNNYTNAYWDGQRMTYGDGASPYNPLVTMEIAGHEIAHGWTSNSSGLIYSYESGALNESFSDILGVSIDFFSRPTLANWLMGDGIGGSPFRSMSNPNAYGHPDTYYGTSWYTGTGDNGGVHLNSGVQNYWYYLMVNGGIGKNDKNDSFKVTRLGLDTASKIVYRNNSFYLISTSQYADARFYAIQSAIDIYGACTPPVINTTNAWHAVGVGAKFDSSVVANFTVPYTNLCEAPQTVQFTNFSKNGGSFKWYFGDGDSSVLTNPRHKYLSNGKYSVTLAVNGGNCGSNTLVKTNYIFIDPHNDCLYNMGDTNFSTACFGTLYDYGGLYANYADNRSDTIRISPTGASSIFFRFNDFDIEAGTTGTTCNYDYLQMHNGTSVAATSLGKWCNNNPPSSTGYTTGSSGTMRMYTDGGGSFRGFELKWQCTVPNAKPAARFTASTLSTCTGLINFTDESYNSPTNWNWSFGDGGTSTLQNPSYTYNASGVYDVKLIVSNSFGSDTFTKQAYITVSRPAAPVANSERRCGTGSLTLTATASGSIQWYDSLSSSNILFTGSPYSTPSLSASRSYYVQSVMTNSPKNVGPVDTNVGAGGIHSSAPSAYMIFDCYRPCRLNSVKVRASGTRNRRIQLMNRFGVVLRDTVINIPAGTQVVNLGFELPMGTDLRLAIHKDSAAFLYRNTTGIVYPMAESTGLVSIKGHSNMSTAPSYYYYFYDWVLQEAPCVSPRTMVNAKIQQAINLKNLDTFNCNGSTIILTPNGNDIDSVYWTTGAIAANSRTVAPPTNTDYIYTAFNACGAYRDTATVLSQAYATLVASNDTSICSGQTVKLKANSNYTPNWIGQGVNDSILTVTPMATTSYYVQSTNLCGSKKDTIVVTVINPATLVAQNDTSICSTNSATLTANSPLPITWYPMSTAGSSVTVNPSASTFYYAQVSNLCGTKRDTVNVAVFNPLNLSASNDTAICIGQTVKLKAKSTQTPTWTNLSITDTLVTMTPTVTTNYFVQVSNLCGTLKDTVNVSVVNQPNLVAQNDTAICIGTSITITATSSLPITWLPGSIVSSSLSISPTVNTSYYATVNNLCGTKRDTIQVTVVNDATLTVSDDTSVCGGQSVILRAKTNGTVNWTSLGSTDTLVTVNPSIPTIYPVIASTLCGIVKDTIQIGILPNPKVVASSDTNVCLGNSVTLSATSSQPIFWYPGAISGNTYSVTPNISQPYYAEVSNSCGIHRDSVNITVVLNSTITRSKDSTICRNSSGFIKATSNSSFLWSSLGLSDSVVSVSPLVRTKYPIVASNICGTLSDTITINVVTKPTIQVSNDTTICKGNPILLNAISIDSVTWYPSGIPNSKQFYVTPATTGFFYAATKNACGLSRDTVRVTVLMYPLLSRSNDTSICLGTSAELFATSNGNLEWKSLGSNSNSVTVKPKLSSKYFIKTSNSCGVLTDSIRVTVVPLPKANFSKVVNGSSTFMTSTSLYAASYKWDFGDGGTSSLPNPIYSYKENGLYTVWHIASNSCGQDSLKSTVIINITNGIQNFSLNDWKIYPNPAQDYVMIDLSGINPGRELISIQLYSADGKRVLHQFSDMPITRLPVVKLPSGTYTLRLQNNQVDLTKKIEILK